MTARAQNPGGAPQDPGRSVPFSRPVNVRRLPDGAVRHEIEASPAECAALAAAIGVVAVASLRAEMELRRRAGGRVALTGSVSAEVTQTCVVTLEPFATGVEQDIDLAFAPAEPEPAGDRRRDGAEAPPPRSVPGSDDQIDPPDPIRDDIIDLGAVAAEFVALALEPYPRRPGATFSDVVDPRDADEPSPFAALERLKARS